MKYFLNASTVETVKMMYRKLALENHPDRGGDTATMAEINRQYEDALKRLDGTESDGRTYRYDAAKESEIMDVIRALLAIPGIDVDLVGRWLWISGETRPVKDQLKALGCRWSPDKSLWYWRSADSKRPWKGTGNFEDICNTYGAQRLVRKHVHIAA